MLIGVGGQIHSASPVYIISIVALGRLFTAWRSILTVIMSALVVIVGAVTTFVS